MRLFITTLAASAFAFPAFAAGHPVRHHHHHWSSAAHLHRLGVRTVRVAEPFGAAAPSGHGGLDAMIARHAQANGVPESLVHRVVIRESRYNARAVGSGGALGLMQIKYATARAMGYTGSPAGLLDPETNLTYAVRYLAGAYRASGGNAGGAVSNYARGYYASAKRQGFSPYGTARGAYVNSYAEAQPVEQVAWTGTAVRRTRGLRHY